MLVRLGGYARVRLFAAADDRAGWYPVSRPGAVGIRWQGMEMSGHIKLWDAPLRLFHWLFAGAVIAAIVTGWVGGSLMPRHGRLGLLVLGLLVFRLIWGFVGSTYARWPRIFAATFGVKDYLQATGAKPGTTRSAHSRYWPCCCW